MTTRPRTVALLGALVIVTAACGSTVQIDGAVPASGAAGEQPGPTGGDDNGLAMGLEMDDSGGTDTTAGGTAATDSSWSGAETTTSSPGSATSGAGGGATGSGAGSSTGSSQTTGSSASQPADSRDGLAVAPGTPGVTDDKIFIGFSYADDAGAANESAGFEEFSRGDQRRNHEVMLEHINSTGGIAGRELVPVFHVWSESSNQSFEEREQQMCATWTQDNEVFAAAIAIATDTLRQCLQNAGVGLISTQGLGLTDDKTLQTFPHAVEPTNLSLNPMARLMVRGLAAQGYYAPPGPAMPTKVGVITYDYPTFRRAVDEDLVPALKAQGLDVVPPVYVRFQHRTSDVGEISAQLSNTVLRFKTEGVTHVHIFEMNALLAVLFMNNAEPQSYRPEYGFNTQNGGQLIVGSVPAEQLEGTTSIGWLPLIDVLEVPDTPERRRCHELFAEGDVQFSSKNAEAIGMNFCDTYWVLRAGIENSPGPLSRDNLTRGLEGLGTSFRSAMVGEVRLAPDRHYGVSTYRASAYVSECGCFRYISGPTRIG